MKLTFSSNYKMLGRRLNHIQTEMTTLPEKLAKEVSHVFYEAVTSNLETQGRGSGIPLSTATKHIYDIDGEPNGDALKNTIEIKVISSGNKWVGVVGIPAGEPTMIAHVQDMGATIPVSDAMRGFLAHRGIYLKAETSHIHVPGRRFWRMARNTTKIFIRKKLKNVLH